MNNTKPSYKFPRLISSAQSAHSRLEFAEAHALAHSGRGERQLTEAGAVVDEGRLRDPDARLPSHTKPVPAAPGTKQTTLISCAAKWDLPNPAMDAGAWFARRLAVDLDQRRPRQSMKKSAGIGSARQHDAACSIG